MRGIFILLVSPLNLDLNRDLRTAISHGGGVAPADGSDELKQRYARRIPFAKLSPAT
jgi:hypothetical protein